MYGMYILPMLWNTNIPHNFLTFASLHCIGIYYILFNLYDVIFAHVC